MPGNRRRTDKEDEGGLPRVIPEVVFKNGEPMIAREMVVKPSPIPRSLAIILILLASISVGITVWGQAQRNNDNYKQNKRIDAIVKQQGEDIEANRQLIIRLLAAKTPEEAKKLLEDFVKDNAPKTSPSPKPNTKSQAPSKTQPSPSARRYPSPRPTSKPSPKPTKKPTPSPSPSPTCSLPRPNPLVPCL